jgi:hypothetical protein
MKLRRVILSVFTVILITLILSLSTGFTLVVHSCSMSGSQSLSTEFFSNPQPREVNSCCSNTSDEHGKEPVIEEENCCKTSVEKIKLNNYLPVEKAKIQISLNLISGIPVNDITHPPLNQSFFITNNIPGRYGGRSIVTYCHQFLI